MLESGSRGLMRPRSAGFVKPYDLLARLYNSLEARCGLCVFHFAHTYKIFYYPGLEFLVANIFSFATVCHLQVKPISAENDFTFLCFVSCFKSPNILMYLFLYSLRNPSYLLHDTTTLEGLWPLSNKDWFISLNLATLINPPEVE